MAVTHLRRVSQSSICSFPWERSSHLLRCSPTCYIYFLGAGSPLDLCKWLLITWSHQNLFQIISKSISMNGIIVMSLEEKSNGALLAHGRGNYMNLQEWQIRCCIRILLIHIPEHQGFPHQHRSSKIQTWSHIWQGSRIRNVSIGLLRILNPDAANALVVENDRQYQAGLLDVHAVQGSLTIPANTR